MQQVLFGLFIYLRTSEQRNGLAGSRMSAQLHHPGLFCMSSKGARQPWIRHTRVMVGIKAHSSYGRIHSLIFLSVLNRICLPVWWTQARRWARHFFIFRPSSRGLAPCRCKTVRRSGARVEGIEFARTYPRRSIWKANKCVPSNQLKCTPTNK